MVDTEAGPRPFRSGASEWAGPACDVV
jgi:hypothetical protein